MSKTLSVAEHFAPGDKVAVIPRTTDFAPASTRGAAKTVSVDKSGEIKTDGLTEFGEYWLSDGDRAVAVTVPGSLSSEAGTQAALAEETEKRASARAEVRKAHPHLNEPQHLPDDNGRDPGVPEHNYEKGDEPEPAPHAKYVDMPKGTPQRVGADIGTAYPVDPDEIQPQPGQQHVKDGIPQRLGADEGYAYPVDPAEVQPAKKYEDEKGPQRVGADTGQAEPIAKGSKKEQELAKDSSVSKAKGANAPKAGTSKTPAKAKKGAPSSRAVKNPVKKAGK